SGGRIAVRLATDCQAPAVRREHERERRPTFVGKRSARHRCLAGQVEQLDQTTRAADGERPAVPSEGENRPRNSGPGVTNLETHLGGTSPAATTLDLSQMSCGKCLRISR